MGRIDVDLERVLTALVVEESVPYLAAHRHTEAGLGKRAEWECDVGRVERRREDRGEGREVGEIPVPPSYSDKDFRAVPHYRQLRGKLDVPKERFISVPEGRGRVIRSPVIGLGGLGSFAARVRAGRPRDVAA